MVFKKNHNVLYKHTSKSKKIYLKFTRVYLPFKNCVPGDRLIKCHRYQFLLKKKKNNLISDLNNNITTTLFNIDFCIYFFFNKIRVIRGHLRINIISVLHGGAYE